MKLFFPPKLFLLFISLVIAVTALSSVGFFADRINKALKYEKSSFLAADFVLEQGQPIPTEWILKAKNFELKTSRLVTFPSIIFISEKPKLVQIKAVDDNYPLKGDLKISGLEILSVPPKSGEVAIAQKLYSQLQKRKNLSVGNKKLKIIGRINKEPDINNNLFQLAPRILINWKDAKDTGLLGPASRASYRLLISGNEEYIEKFKLWVKSKSKNTKFIVAENGRSEVNNAIEIGQKFLNLSALCASILAGIAIILATRRFINLVLGEAVVLRTLGMTASAVLNRYMVQLVKVTLVASTIGCFFGYICQAALVYISQDYVSNNLPLPGVKPILFSFLPSFILTLGFALPSLFVIKKISPMDVLCKNNISLNYSYGLITFIAVCSYFLLVFWQVKNAELAVISSIGLIIVLSTFAILSNILIKILTPLRKSGNLSLGLAALQRDKGLSLLQISGFGLAITLLMILTLLKIDILDKWEKNIPIDTPNYFLINIQKNELNELKNLLLERNTNTPNFYQTIRGRLKKISEKKIESENYSSSRAKRLSEREFNLGFSSKLQTDNKIILGSWLQPGEKAFSVEEGIAKELGINIGDILYFDIAGQILSAPVSSIRKVSWDSFNVNFFVQGSPELLEEIPFVYITSIYIDKNNEEVIKEIGKKFPAISIISIDSLLKKLKDIISKGTLAIEGVFLFTLLAAFLISIAAIQISRDQRSEEIALLKILGASRNKILSLTMGEFLVIGSISGLMGAFLANILSIFFAEYLFEINSSFNMLSFLIGGSIGIVIVTIIGYFSCSSLINTAPIKILQK